MKTLIATVLALTLLGGCCKTANTDTTFFKSPLACQPKQARLAADPCVFVGPTGPAGADGPCSLALTGAPGRDGIQGPRGPAGGVIRGPVGLAGGPGAKGAGFAPPEGEQGDAGDVGARGDVLVGPPGDIGSPGRAGASVAGIRGIKGKKGPSGNKGPVGSVNCWSLYRSGRNGPIDVAEVAGFLKVTPSLQIKVVGGVSLKDQLIQAGVSKDRIVFESSSGQPELYLMSLPE